MPRITLNVAHTPFMVATCGFGALDVWLVRGLETLTPWL